MSRSRLDTQAALLALHDIPTFRIAGSTAVAPLLFLPPQLPAQGGDDKCEKAVKIIENGHPAEADGWAYAHARRCGGPATQAYAKGLARYVTETNVAALEQYMTQVDDWRDASIYRAAVELANNSAATQRRRTEEIIMEILDAVRSIERRLAAPVDGIGIPTTQAEYWSVLRQGSPRLAKKDLASVHETEQKEEIQRILGNPDEMRRIVAVMLENTIKKGPRLSAQRVLQLAVFPGPDDKTVGVIFETPSGTRLTVFTRTSRQW